MRVEDEGGDLNMSVFGLGLSPHKPVPMPSVMPLIPVPRFYDVEIYYNDGTAQKFSNVEWIGGDDECIILSKNGTEQYIFKQAVKYINRIRVEEDKE